MPYFTPEELSPRESTLELIRQVAYSYRPVKVAGTNISYSLN